MAHFDIIDFLFYSAYKQYQKWGEKDIPGIYAVCFISLLQLFNALTLLILGVLFKIVNLDKVESFHIVFFVILILLINYMYIYKKRGKENIIEYYSKQCYLRSIKLSSLLYVSLTVFFFVTVLLYYIYS
mgnify:CR=1 FL=1